MNGDTPDLERLGELGRVDPPAPGVLDAAREILWSAVAAEMLTSAPPDAAHPDAARTDAAHAGGETAAGRAVDDIASRPRPEDPGVR